MPNLPNKKTDGALEKKWDSYTGTGVTANKGKDAIALREAVGGGEFAIVKLIGGCWTNSPMKVLEEIKTSDLNVAEARFNQLSRELGFEPQPIRRPGLLFS